eukprot:TRINITY_DN5441_c0_g1_i9.p2 TRINITY_DN5441_c0_g1~~TRINITY_DN5441_c0_g1_i9.p2  ORF type:complete len:248 (-),score=-20.59 TRINITY_DN5441_c0_g1_i9:1086-1829(-)
MQYGYYICSYTLTFTLRIPFLFPIAEQQYMIFRQVIVFQIHYSILKIKCRYLQIEEYYGYRGVLTFSFRRNLFLIYINWNCIRSINILLTNCISYFMAQNRYLILFYGLKQIFNPILWLKIDIFYIWQIFRLVIDDFQELQYLIREKEQILSFPLLLDFFVLVSFKRKKNICFLHFKWSIIVKQQQKVYFCVLIQSVFLLQLVCFGMIVAKLIDSQTKPQKCRQRAKHYLKYNAQLIKLKYCLNFSI